MRLFKLKRNLKIASRNKAKNSSEEPFITNIHSGSLRKVYATLFDNNKQRFSYF